MSTAQELNEKLTTLMEDQAFENNVLDAYESVRGYIESVVKILKLEAFPQNFDILCEALKHLKNAAKLYQDAEDYKHSDDVHDQDEADQMLQDCYDEIKLAQKAFN